MKINRKNYLYVANKGFVLFLFSSSCFIFTIFFLFFPFSFFLIFFYFLVAVSCIKLHQPDLEHGLVLHQPSSLLQGLSFFPLQLLRMEFPFNPWPFSSPQPLNSFPRVPVAIHPN
jgi:hypothetical protein